VGKVSPKKKKKKKSGGGWGENKVPKNRDHGKKKN
jgi:hypothetical protein